MKYCKYCKTEVDSVNNFCPLCFNHLDDLSDKSDHFYSVRTCNETTNLTNAFLYKFFLFFTICAISCCVIINLLVTPNLPWFWIVVFGLLYVWVLVAHTILSNQSAFKKTFLQIVSILLLLYFAENISFSRWLIPYVFPSISLTAIFVLLMILFISKKRTEYVFGFSVIILLLAVLSALIIIFGLSEYMLLNMINLIISLMTLVGNFIFGLKAIKEDLFKKLHL